MNDIASPCISICVLEEKYGYCLGCARTLGEIAEWASASAAHRQEILASLPARRALLPEIPEDML